MSDSFWKKDISFGRKPKSVEDVQPEVAPAVKAVLEPEVVVEPVAFAPAAPSFPAAPPVVPVLGPETYEPAAPPPVSGPTPGQTTAALPAVTGDYGWLTSSFDPNDVPDEMPAIVPPLVSLPAQPLPASANAVAREPEPELDPELDPVEPSPAAPSKPFWKKELSFSRGSKEPAEPKAPKAPKEKSAPFWKRELSFSRGSKEPAEPTAPKAPKEKSAPFWKKELSLRSKQPTATPAAEAARPAEKKPPIWKRELKLSKSKVDDAPKAAKQPRAKKQKGGAAKTGLVGLKIGASQVAAVRVSNNGSPELLQVARAPLAKGVVVGGELRDVDALAATLKELFGKNKLPKRGVRLGIANNRIGVRTFEISGIEDEGQLANAIRFRAQETLPIPLEEAVLDWQVLSERTDENGLITRRVLLVVAYRELVDQYVAACKKAGIKLSGIDLEAFAMLRALTTPPAVDAGDPTAAQVLVNVGHDRSTFAVTDGVHCEFTRVLGWGGQSLSLAIAGALDIELEDATPIKHQISLVTDAVDVEGVDPATLDTAREAVRRELQSFARELVSSLRFYQNQPGSLGIGEVVLTGGTAHLPGFGEELNRLIGVPVRIGDPLSRVTIPKKFRQDDDYAVGSLTVAIGLGIED